MEIFINLLEDERFPRTNRQAELWMNSPDRNLTGKAASNRWEEERKVNNNFKTPIGDVTRVFTTIYRIYYTAIFSPIKKWINIIIYPTLMK